MTAVEQETSAGPGTEYLVSHGKSGAFGRFVSPTARFRRAERVVVQTYRGLELGKVLCEATERHRQALPHSPGQVVRRATRDDELQARLLEEVGRQIFAAAGKSARQSGALLEVLDVEVLIDGRRAVLHYLASEHADIAPLLTHLANEFQLEVFAENLATPAHAEEHGGCGKPDCGKTSGGGGCSSCESGGCSSCGHGGVDMTAYFAHLRGKMEASGRTPLV